MTKNQLKKLQQKWYNRLKREGFKDIEYADGSLKQDGDKKGPGFHNQELIRDRYSWIENVFMEDCSAKDRRILALYVQGIQVSIIARQARVKYNTARWCIERAKKAYVAASCGYSKNHIYEDTEP